MKLNDVERMTARQLLIEVENQARGGWQRNVVYLLKLILKGAI